MWRVCARNRLDRSNRGLGRSAYSLQPTAYSPKAYSLSGAAGIENRGPAPGHDLVRPNNRFIAAPVPGSFLRGRPEIRHKAHRLEGQIINEVPVTLPATPAGLWFG